MPWCDKRTKPIGPGKNDCILFDCGATPMLAHVVHSTTSDFTISTSPALGGGRRHTVQRHPAHMRDGAMYLEAPGRWRWQGGLDWAEAFDALWGTK